MHVPFPFQIAVRDGAVSGWFFNGEERVVSSAGRFKNGHLVLEFPTYARRLDATLGPDGTLAGSYLPTTPGVNTSPYAFQAQHAGRHKDDPHPPDISGEWLIAMQQGAQGETAWRLIAHQEGSQVKAAVLRVGGDSGELSGFWREGSLLLSHFDGARPAVIQLTPAEGGTLRVLVRDRHEGKDMHLTAYRAAQAQASGVPQAADPSQHTRMKDPSEPFRFSFPDLDGHLVSSTDRRFRGKVLLIDIGGSWCANCHDEAPFLEDLHRKYHRRGLEVVTLSFEEEAEQVANPTRLRAFIQRYGLDYTLLLAGTTDELHAKVPQAQGLDAYPTTFFIGRDGRVRAVHAGFAARVTGEYNTRLRQEFTRQIEQLLAEKAPQARGHDPS
jgi:peroxiredoxin